MEKNGRWAVRQYWRTWKGLKSIEGPEKWHTHTEACVCWKVLSRHTHTQRKKQDKNWAPLITRETYVETWWCLFGGNQHYPGLVILLVIIINEPFCCWETLHCNATTLADTTEPLMWDNLNEQWAWKAQLMTPLLTYLLLLIVYIRLAL